MWDPATRTQTRVTFNDGYNIFCSGLSFMADGNLFIAGGNKDQQLDGIVQTTYFNWSTGTWAQGVNMTYARWYPTVTAMGNSEMLITSGGPAIPEVRQNDGTLRTLSNASLSLPLYPWFDVAPDGRAFDSGPDQTMRSLDPTGAGAWQIWSSRDTIDRDYGSHAMYDIGKILVAGGGPSTNTADVIDVNGATPTVTPTGSMAFGRRQNNLTVLADGTVLVTGGNSSGASTRGHERGRVRGRAVEPRDRAVDDAVEHAGDTPVSLHRAASPRRTRPVRGRRDLRDLRHGRLSEQERRDLQSAVPVQEGRAGGAGAATDGHLGARVPSPKAGSSPSRRPAQGRSPRSRWSSSELSPTPTTWISATCRSRSLPETARSR